MGKLNIAPSQCLDASIFGNILWIALMNEADADDFDIFFCDLEHFLMKRVPSSADKWKFQRMCKRNEYIDRILRGIENEFDFDIFYQNELMHKNNNKNANNLQKIHEKILHFWMIRLVDDPQLELSH